MGGGPEPSSPTGRSHSAANGSAGTGATGHGVSARSSVSVSGAETGQVPLGSAPPAVADAPTPTSVSLEQLMGAWQLGALSTFDYLVAVNLAAGRRWGDRMFHMAR